MNASWRGVVSLAALAVALGACNCKSKVEFGKSKGPKKNDRWAEPKYHDDYEEPDGKDAEDDGGAQPAQDHKSVR